MIHRIYNSKTHVLLDNGHGIDTPGKRSPVFADGTQLFEYEFNRDIVSKISGYLQLSKISHSIVVPEENDIPLPDRVERINNFCNENKKQFIYLVSIHGNAAKNPSANGIEVWTSKGNTKSDELAPYFYNSLKKLGWKMRPNNSLELDREENFYILKKTVCPAILTENGFYTNYNECKLMNEFYWRQQIALAHVRAINEIEFDYAVK
jgi:N-acetylmuramoyl-L-alanine amidase